jgi:hypothetical protein
MRRISGVDFLSGGKARKGDFTDSNESNTPNDAEAAGRGHAKAAKTPHERSPVKRKVFLAGLAGIALLLGFSLIACDNDSTGGGGSGTSVPSELRGIWECVEATTSWVPGSGWQTLKGTLVIKTNSVTVSGPVAHLQNFTRDIALEAYAEDGLLYIKDTGEWKSPVAYRRWQSADRSDTLVTLSGGGVADETLKRIGN